MNLHSKWQERLFFERLERKSKPIFDLLTTNHDWGSVVLSFGEEFWTKYEW
jgi:hypothetical protein